MPDVRTCQSCGKPFEALVVGGGMGSRELEDLTCPFCGRTKKVLSAGRIVTRALPDSKERDPGADGPQTPD